ERLRPDGSLRPVKHARGLILSTAEEVPRGQSARARALILEIGEGDVIGPRPPAHNPQLAACQADAAAGLYAQSMAAYLQWLAPRYSAVRQEMRAKLTALRTRIMTEGNAHARTPGILADLALGLHLFLDFAAEAGAITARERRDLETAGWQALALAAGEQAGFQLTSEPTGHFLRLFAACLASGRAHLASPDGSLPADKPERWGWQRNSAGYWEANGKRIGWVDSDAVFLEPEAAFADVQRLAGEQGENLSVGTRTLWRRMKEKGVLASWDEKRQRHTVRLTLEGARRE